MGEAAERRARHDFFPTPPECVRAILPHVAMFAGGAWRGGRILEPAAGHGHLLRVLAAHGAPREAMDAVELRPEAEPHLRGQVHQLVLGDFLRVAGGLPRYELIIGNPPYGRRLPQAFVETALSRLAPGGQLCFLLRANFSTGVNRCRLFRRHPADYHALGWRPSFTSDGVTGNALDFGWFVWTEGRSEPGRFQVLPRPEPADQLVLGLEG